MSQQIVMCGIPRSGSTLVWQILQAVFADEFILKTHPDIWEPDGSTVIVSIRNPFDVVASLLRVRLSREGRNEFIQDDIENVLGRTILCFERLDGLLYGSHALLRYEHFYNDYSLIYDVIRSIFGFSVSFLDRKRINEQFSLKNNQERAAALKDFNEVDLCQIHGDHIGCIHPGYWERYLPDWSFGQVVDICEPICEEWGYE